MPLSERHTNGANEIILDDRGRRHRELIAGAYDQVYRPGRAVHAYLEAAVEVRRRQGALEAEHETSRLKVVAEIVIDRAARAGRRKTIRRSDPVSYTHLDVYKRQILAFVAYNAGPRRAREWIEQYGDPRNPKVDPIDWIERIPISETRNYVQRVIENMQIYRARLGNDPRLLIEADLHRGG